MEDQNLNATADSSLQQNWESVREHRQELAAELDQMARDLPSDGGQRLRSLSRWFRGAAEWDVAIKRADVLGVSLPLLKVCHKRKPTQADIGQAARLGVCGLSRDRTNQRRLGRLLLYPVLVLLGSAMLAIGLSFWLIIHFEQIYADFGIELPSMTLLVIWIARLIRQWWWLGSAVAVGLAVWVWFLNRAGRGQRPANVSWLDQRLMSRRNSLAAWTWHVSLLLEAGISQQKAISTAGLATGNAWLQKISLAGTENDQPDETESTREFLFDPKYELLDTTIQMPTSPGKVALLQEIATYYWDRNRNVGEWWIQWLLVIMLWMIGAAIVVCVLSMFMPLIAIISGLTSVK